ncbi:MAG: ATP-binding protein [Dysgonamonadaceae bacterium]|nr:ATP-binding protein [Dysgonamonadaceae bacterium]
MINQQPFKLTIASGKGGTGKTTLSTNLAAYLAEHEEVVLADLDVEEPNSGLFFNGTLVHEEDNHNMTPNWDESRCTLCGLCQDVCNFNAIIQLGTSILVYPKLCHSCYACSELCPENALPMESTKIGTLRDFQMGKLHYVESRLNIGEEQAVSSISKTKRYVANKYDNISIHIFDSPPGTSCPVMEATKDADYVILITEPTPFGFHDLKLAVETMQTLKKPFGVVINRDGIGDDEVANYCKAKEIEILAKIPNSRKIAELYSKGELIYPKFPEVREALDNILEHCQSIKEGRTV